jgi:hypothetical protein
VALPEERLTEFRYVTLILRLLVDRDDELVRGEVGQVSDEHWVRFQGPGGLPSAVRACLAWRASTEGEVLE